jgi:hypothetical protein
MTGIYIVCGFIALCVIFVLIIRVQSKRIKNYKNENAELHANIQNAAEQLEHLRGYIAKNKLIEEAANAERRELNETADGSLIGRANNLFGVRDKGGGNGAA